MARHTLNTTVLSRCGRLDGEANPQPGWQQGGTRPSAPGASAALPAWINDFTVLETLGAAGLRPTTTEGETAWYERVTDSQTDVSFTIYESESLRPIGNVGLHQIDHFNRTAVFGIVIGEKDCWVRGMAPRPRDFFCTTHLEVWPLTM